MATSERITAKKVERYKDNLYLLISSINEKGTKFVYHKLVKELKLETIFIKAVKNAGYVSEIKKGKGKAASVYKSNIKLTDIEPIHGKVIYEEMSKIRKQLLEKMNVKKVIVEKSKQLEKEISTPKEQETIEKLPLILYSDQQLITELKFRGYTGELTRTLKITI
jgi:hypothetical protein